jgi:hypothetical protein
MTEEWNKMKFMLGQSLENFIFIKNMNSNVVANELFNTSLCPISIWMLTFDKL